MDKFRGFINSFVTEDYFIVVLVILIMILVVLVIALLKTRKEYNEYVYDKKDDEDLLDSLKTNNYTEELPPIDREMDIKVEPISYDDIIDSYENAEEEHAVISTEELEKKAQERFEELGVTDNQAMIQKYEDEQEKKAIISYEQLLKNASNITISYKEEEMPEGAPKINKIEVQEKEVSAPQNYIEEEKFLSILKEFRISLPR